MKISIPNQITLGRLALALVFFVLLAWFHAGQKQEWLLIVCFWLFLVAALGDILDGVVARWLKQVTPFGRIVDPVVDKVMVCGAFVYFSGAHFIQDGHNVTDVAPWMVIVILIRELLVSAIRAHAEALGEGFAANWVGKAKMFIQSATVCVILAQLGWKLDGLAPLRTGCVWFTVIVTALSIIAYVRRARAFLVTSAAADSGSAAPPPPAPPIQTPGSPSADSPSAPLHETRAHLPGGTVT